MMAMVGQTGSFALYGFLEGEYAAASIAAIGSVAGLFQLLMPESRQRKQVIIRNIVAICFSITAVILLYQKPADLFACIGTVIIRIGEAQQSALFMKFAFFTGLLFWALFALLAELYLMAFLKIPIFLSFGIKAYLQWRNRKNRAEI